MNTLRIGLVSISDRASSGVYQDKGIPALEEWLARALSTPGEPALCAAGHSFSPGWRYSQAGADP